MGFTEKLENAIQTKLFLRWTSNVSAGFIAEDIVEIFDFNSETETFRILTHSHKRKEEALLQSFTISETDPTHLNLRESEELLKWCQSNPNLVPV